MLCPSDLRFSCSVLSRRVLGVFDATMQPRRILQKIWIRDRIPRIPAAYFADVSYEETASNSKVLNIAVVGPPNAGKSTLINGLVGRRVCPASCKVHTTRRFIRAISIEDSTQLVFLDTPGLVTADDTRRHNLARAFLSDPETAVLQADIIGVVHDVSNHWTRHKLDLKTLRILQLHSNKPSILILNKVDTLKKKQLLLDVVRNLTRDSLKNVTETQDSNIHKISEHLAKNSVKETHSWPNFNDVFMVSALNGSGIEDLKEYFLQKARPGVWIFKPSQFTDASPEELIVDTVQSKLLEHLPNEIPYNATSAIEYYNINEQGCVVAVVCVTCPSARIQRLIIGKGGLRIKQIEKEAEDDVKSTLHEDVLLTLVVKANA